jgi:hypothetical protein
MLNDIFIKIELIKYDRAIWRKREYNIKKVLTEVEFGDVDGLSLTDNGIYFEDYINRETKFHVA